MENKSGLMPVGRAVLVKTYDPQTDKSIIVIPDSQKERLMSLEQRAVVVAVGNGCWPDEPARAKVGDRVLIAKMSGYMAKGTGDGELYRIVNDRDIFALITNEDY